MREPVRFLAENCPLPISTIPNAGIPLNVNGQAVYPMEPCPMATALRSELSVVEDSIYQTKNRSGQDPLNYPIRLNNQLVALGGVVGSAESAPTQASLDVFDMLSKQLDEQLAKWKQILATDVPAYNDVVKKQEVPAIVLTTKEGS